MNTAQTWAFDTALGLAIDWVDAGMTSPATVTRIRRLATIARIDMETLMDIAESMAN